MDSPYTENLADFGSRERGMFIDLLTAWQETGLPAGFDDSKVRPAMNRNSGAVFLVNEEYQTAMLNGERLELWHFTPHHGHEGFLSDLLYEHEPIDLHQDDADYLIDAIKTECVRVEDLPDEWRKYATDEDVDGE